jgi:hypothetical protein
MRVPKKVNYVVFSTLVLSYILFWIIVAPDVLLHGRFWAEEGTLYWANAYNNFYNGNILNHLFFFAPLAGYINFIANIATLLSVVLVDISLSPLITTWISFFIMLTPATIAFFYFSNKSLSYRFLMSIFLLYSPPALTGEIFANSINSQQFIALSVAMFLLVPSISKWTRLTPYYVIISIGGFSSMISCALSPFFLVRYLKDRKNNFHHLIGFFILLITLTSQILFYRTYPFKSLLYNRTLDFDYMQFMQSITLSFFNLIGGNTLVLIILSSFVSSLFYVIIGSLIFVALLLIYCLRSHFNNSYLISIFLYIYITLIISISAVNQPGYGRYGYIPSILLGMILLNILVETLFTKMRYVNLCIISYFFLSFYFNFNHLEEFVNKSNNCLEWSKQVVQSRITHLDYSFWPCYDNPIWKLDSKNIEPTIVEFQKEILINQS